MRPSASHTTSILCGCGKDTRCRGPPSTPFHFFQSYSPLLQPLAYLTATILPTCQTAVQYMTSTVLDSTQNLRLCKWPHFASVSAPSNKKCSHLHIYTVIIHQLIHFSCIFVTWQTPLHHKTEHVLDVSHDFILVFPAGRPPRHPHKSVSQIT